MKCIQISSDKIETCLLWKEFKISKIQWAGHVIQGLCFSPKPQWVTFVIDTMLPYANSFICVVISEAITGQKAAVIYMKM